MDIFGKKEVKALKIFISWSGDRSKAYAEALQYWINIVLPQVDPWVSSKNITSGQDWHHRVTAELGESRYGITCITPDNQQKPWVNFEAGAISKHVDAKSGLLVPLLFGFEKASDFKGPLSYFQARLATKDEILALMHDINHATDNPRPTRVLDDAMSDSWARLSQRLKVVEEKHDFEKAEPRKESDVMEEVLALLRGMTRNTSSKSQPTFYSGAKLPTQGFFALVEREYGQIPGLGWVIHTEAGQRSARVITDRMPPKQASENVGVIADLVLGWTVEFIVDADEIRRNEEAVERHRALQDWEEEQASEQAAVHEALAETHRPLRI